jgi:hypothetical protein
MAEAFPQSDPHPRSPTACLNKALEKYSSAGSNLAVVARRNCAEDAMFNSKFNQPFPGTEP